jgi:nitronate monooxygenase
VVPAHGLTAALHTELPHVREIFGIGLVDWVIRKEPELLDAAPAAQPVLVSVSFETDMSWVDRAHSAGIAAATQVYNSAEARRRTGGPGRRAALRRCRETSGGLG